MDGCYTVSLDNRVVGNVTVKEEGLYYRIRCQCNFDDDGVYSIWLHWDGGHREKLGICVPGGEGFCLEKSIARKKFRNAENVMFIATSHNEKDSFFVELAADKPFEQIHLLERAVYAQSAGRWGLILPRPTDCQPTASSVRPSE